MDIDSLDRAVTLGEALAALGRGLGYGSVLVGVGWLSWPWCLATAAVAVVLIAGGLLWSQLGPVSFGRASGCLRGWRWRRVIRRDWEIVCRRCGLAEVEVPAVRRSRVAF